MPLLNPGAAFGTMGYGIQVAGGTPCNKLPCGLIDKKLVKVVQAYTGVASEELRIHSELCFGRVQLPGFTEYDQQRE